MGLVVQICTSASEMPCVHAEMVECVVGGAGLVALELIALSAGVVADRRASIWDVRITGDFYERGDRGVVRWTDRVFVLYRRSGLPKGTSGDGPDDRRGARGDLSGFDGRICCIIHRRMELGLMAKQVRSPACA